MFLRFRAFLEIARLGISVTLLPLATARKLALRTPQHGGICSASGRARLGSASDAWMRSESRGVLTAYYPAAERPGQLDVPRRL